MDQVVWTSHVVDVCQINFIVAAKSQIPRQAATLRRKDPGTARPDPPVFRNGVVFASMSQAHRKVSEMD